jgi:hypothetical protein
MPRLSWLSLARLICLQTGHRPRVIRLKLLGSPLSFERCSRCRCPLSVSNVATGRMADLRPERHAID